MLDQDAEETLDAAEECAMHHDGAMLLSILTGVLEFESCIHVEVELHGAQLPEAAEHVDEFDVDLGAVEGSLAGDFLVGDFLCFEHTPERSGSHLPVFIR